MRKAFGLIFFMLLFLHCKSQKDSAVLRLGIHIDSLTDCSCKKKISIIIGFGSIMQGIECNIRGISFEVAFSVDSTITYYATEDSNFTVNNFRYLTRNKRVVDSLKKGIIIFDTFQGFYIDLVQDWKLGFYLKDVIMKDNRPRLKRNALPRYIFKSNL